MVVERWSGAQLAVTPATNSLIHDGTGTPTATITTTAANSIITWANVDENSRDPNPVFPGIPHAYLSGAIEDGLADAHSVGNTVQYYAYQTAAVAGSQTIGMSEPSTQNWTMTGIEVQDAATPPPTPPPGAAFLAFF
jgi:hypothetical protein